MSLIQYTLIENTNERLSERPSYDLKGNICLGSLACLVFELLLLLPYPVSFLRFPILQRDSYVCPSLNIQTESASENMGT